MSTATCPECRDLFENDAAIESDMRGGSSEPAHYRWRVAFPDGTHLEVAYSPPATHGEALDAFPEAVAAEPMAEPGIAGPPTTICEAGNAKPGLPLGHLPKI